MMGRPLRRREVRSVPQVNRTAVMGTIACQEVYGINGAKVLELVCRELHRLDALWSPYRPGNMVDAIRKAAGREPVTADPDTLQVLKTAKSLGLFARGSFDITLDPLLKLWRRAARAGRPPSGDEVEALLPLVNIRDLELDSDKGVYLHRRGQGVDLGGIGKGYAADRVGEIYRQAGIRHALVSIGGNVLVLNGKPDGTPWRIGIKDPACPNGKLTGYIEAENCSVVTSGDYEQYFEYSDSAGGTQRYHHIIDPRTGWPVESGIAGVTVMSPSSTLADALATAVFVLGPEEGLALCDFFTDTHVLVIDQSGALRMTAGMRNMFTEAAVRYGDIGTDTVKQEGHDENQR